jgi:hypothetical protein
MNDAFLVSVLNCLADRIGTVYMAEQTRPVERQVALKVIKAGMDTLQVIARIEAELIRESRKILGRFRGACAARYKPTAKAARQLRDCRIQPEPKCG